MRYREAVPFLRLGEAAYRAGADVQQWFAWGVGDSVVQVHRDK